MKPFLAIAITLSALWTEWPRSTPQPAQVPPPSTGPAPAPQKPTEAPAPAVPPKKTVAPAPSPSPVLNLGYAIDVSRDSELWIQRRQRQVLALNRFLFEDLKLSLAAVFEYHQAMSDFEAGLNRELLVEYARDDMRGMAAASQRLTQERDQRIEHLMGKDRYDRYLAYLERDL